MASDAGPDVFPPGIMSGTRGWECWSQQRQGASSRRRSWRAARATSARARSGSAWSSRSRSRPSSPGRTSTTSSPSARGRSSARRAIAPTRLRASPASTSGPRFLVASTKGLLGGMPPLSQLEIVEAVDLLGAAATTRGRDDGDVFVVDWGEDDPWNDDLPSQHRASRPAPRTSRPAARGAPQALPVAAWRDTRRALQSVAAESAPSHAVGASSRSTT